MNGEPVTDNGRKQFDKAERCFLLFYYDLYSHVKGWGRSIFVMSTISMLTYQYQCLNNFPTLSVALGREPFIPSEYLQKQATNFFIKP